MTRIHQRLYVSFLLMGASLAASAQTESIEVRYNLDVLPILADHCFACHGPDAGARKADLRLDMPSTVTGSAGASELLDRVTSIDAEERMPPADHAEPLDASQIATLEQWIRDGGQYEKHWAYVKPTRPVLPEVSNVVWAQNSIDHFVLARLEAEGLSPAAPADDYALIRRLSFDLTGLPPTIEEADAFVNDPAEDRVDRVVDRLLSSAAYGEHVGRYWLDLARYADSNGYHIDTKRSIWPYRDWVIKAFNRNLPFDEFTIEQIAGDLLADATLDQKIATGFNRNTMFNEEGGIDPEEFRTKAVVDRVVTTMNAWMGTTMGCAECHDHKYDPFSQKEFYELYAFFNNVPELGGGTFQSLAPLVSLPLDDAKRAELSSVESVIESLTRERAQLDAEPIANLTRWVSTARDERAAWTRLSLEHSSGMLTIDAPISTTDMKTLALEFAPSESTFEISHIDARIVNGPAIILSRPRSTYSADGHPPANTTDEDANRETFWRTSSWADSLLFDVDPVASDEGAILRLTLTVRADNKAAPKIQLWTSYIVQEHAAPHLLEVIGADEVGWTDDERAAIEDHARTTGLAALDARIATLNEKRDALKESAVTTLVMGEMAEARPTHIHTRGNFLDPAERVYANVPAVLHPIPGSERPSRLDFARWLVDSENPLTARVTVNRIWAYLFGRGLVETLDDFGTRGARPSHPELLDYLATEFVASGWDVKSLYRLIVTSATYQQSSKVGFDGYARDPHNILLARGPRFRLDGEAIRDNALAASGLLVRTLGGPPAYPYQPAGLYEEKIQTGYDVGAWPIESGPDLYRRGVYTFRRRSVPYPTFQLFDGPSFEFCTASRPRTDTPLQALASLNDPQFFEAARVLAERVLKSTSELDERLTLAFRLCLTRPPTPRELEHLRTVHGQQSVRFTADPEAAQALIANGRNAVDTTLPPHELAAWTMIANVLLSLDETIVKG